MSGVLSRICSLSMPSLSFRKKPLIGGRRSLTGFLESQPKKWKSILICFCMTFTKLRQVELKFLDMLTIRLCYCQI
ncbi:hypothetical protein Goshw_004581, partial [Gossypium schwendimanii]|nr:hypothetical protein [Gossypium schwendimanii]